MVPHAPSSTTTRSPSSSLRARVVAALSTGPPPIVLGGALVDPSSPAERGGREPVAAPLGLISTVPKTGAESNASQNADAHTCRRTRNVHPGTNRIAACRQSPAAAAHCAVISSSVVFCCL